MASGNFVEEADEDGSDEEYNDFEEDDEDNGEEVKPFLERTKPQTELEPVREQVKEMKSVDEEDSDEEEGTSSMKINLKDITDLKTPTDEHEQNEQSFRAKAEKKNAAVVKDEKLKKVVDDDGEDSYS